jgi:plasmid stabilization system protein ParE
MNSQEFYFTASAENTFREHLARIQQVSLIAAEQMRNKIFHKLHLIHHHPLQGSRKADIPGLEGHFRVATVLNYKIYYKVEDKRVIVVDMLLDKDSQVDRG